MRMENKRSISILCKITLFLSLVCISTQQTSPGVLSIDIVDSYTGEIIQSFSQSNSHSELILSRYTAINFRANTDVNVNRVDFQANITSDNKQHNYTFTSTQSPFQISFINGSDLPSSPLIHNGTLSFSATSNLDDLDGSFIVTIQLIWSENGSVSSLFPMSKGWGIVRDLQKQPNEAVYKYLRIFGEMCKETYLPQMYNTVTAPEGWQRSGIQRNSDGVIHSLVYYDFNYQVTKRVVIAFRGTADNYDTCVDKDLYPYLFVNNTEVDKMCAEISKNFRLNYYEQTIELYNQVKSQLPDAEILFTGHSLGSALAQLAGMATKSPAVTFSGLGTRDVIKQKNIVNTDTSMIYNYYDISDPVVVKTDSVQIGNLLAWNTSRPVSCVQCYMSGNPAFCDSCFKEVHYFSHILDLIGGGGNTTLLYSYRPLSSPLVPSVLVSYTVGHPYTALIVVLTVGLVIFAITFIVITIKCKPKKKYSFEKTIFC